MRVALVSPYSYTYPGGVGRHVEALAAELVDKGHDVRLLAPVDPDDRFARLSHKGARPERRELPDYLISLGRTVGLPANGAVSNLSVFGEGAATTSRALRQGGFDVVHVHEPNAPVASWAEAGSVNGDPPGKGQVFFKNTSSGPRSPASLTASSSGGNAIALTWP